MYFQMLTRRAIQRVHSFCTTSALQEQRALWRADERNPYVETPEAWVTSLCEQQERLSIVRLHPGEHKENADKLLMELLAITS